MRIPGPYSDDTWDAMSRPLDAAEAAAKAQAANGISHVLWELGLMLFVPLAGASLIGLTLKAFNIH